MDGHPLRVGVGLLVPSLDDVAASLGTRLRKWQRRRGGTILVEQIAGAPVPQILESFVDGVQHVPKERVQNRVGEQIGAVPVPQIWEPIGEGVQFAPQERVLSRTQEQIVGVPLLGSWRPPWKLCELHHRSVCFIVRRSRLWMSLCLGS